MARKLAGIRLIFVLVSVITLLFMVWLVSLSAWWLLLAVPVSVLCAIGVLLLLIGKWLTNLVKPDMTDLQSDGVTIFVDKLERVAESVQTPVFMIAFYVLRDVIRTPEHSYVERLARDSGSLHSDLLKLRKLFI
jgi:hypothetical protein